MNVNTVPEMDYFSFGSPTVRVCPREGDELGSESNPIVISDSEPLGSPSNPIVIHCDECNFCTDRLPAQPSSDADTELMCTQEFWNAVISDIDPDSPIDDLEAGSRASHPGFDEFSTGGPLSAGQLLGGDRRGTMVSTSHESTAEECHAEERTSSDISGTVPTSHVLPSICSSSGQSQATTQLSPREFQAESVGRTGRMEDGIAQLGSPSNSIVSRIENAPTCDCATEEYNGWFDVDYFQPKETREFSADQVEVIDLTSVPCLDDPQHKKDILTWPKEIHASPHQAEPNKDEIPAELEEDTSSIAAETNADGISTEPVTEIDASLPNSGTRADSLPPKGPSMTNSEKTTLKRKLPSSDTRLELRRSQRMAKKMNT
ncbi:hypothetical protein PENFLA_c017G04685 [Penicillium flavigenum]|uniref:Uncharacterized protein n=1 Tax=Penicillium flavigenum TaxID=254877 RepID=A0A1V6T1N3_9EURO|nr:hypothetical protein PENFLA_c017G04685 [Penicillium flavigenum]